MAKLEGIKNEAKQSKKEKVKKQNRNAKGRKKEKKIGGTLGGRKKTEWS